MKMTVESAAYVKATLSIEEFREKLGIPEGLSPLTIYISHYKNTVEITMTGGKKT